MSHNQALSCTVAEAFIRVLHPLELDKKLLQNWVVERYSQRFSKRE